VHIGERAEHIGDFLFVADGFRIGHGLNSVVVVLPMTM
jgi:hypothetical protein